MKFTKINIIIFTIVSVSYILFMPISFFSIFYIFSYFDSSIAAHLTDSLNKVWYLKVDMNNDGIFTYTDILLWSKWIFFYPGDSIVSVLLYFDTTSNLLDIDKNNYGGTLSIFVSILSWIFLIFYTLIYLFSYITEREEKKFIQSIQQYLKEEENQKQRENA